jgi:hypothetical protein
MDEGNRAGRRRSSTESHDEGRHALSGFVCNSSWEGWKSASRRHSTTVTALMDAVGHYLAHHCDEGNDDEHELAIFGEAALVAREIDLRRRVRQR